ncbi:MAG TPA: hypothetical protein VFR02_02420, partial [bacterium]|nr:hypothetical protein [bacterium]
MNRPRSGPWGAFLPLVPVLGLVWERFHTYWEAQQPAVTTAALIGHGLLQGRPLYSDLWDPHPPALSLSYALAEALGGDGPYSIFLLGLGTGLGTLAALTLAGRAYGGPAAGLLAACLWAIVSGDPTVWANQPLAGSFVNLFAAWALWFLLEEGKGRPGTRAKLAAGTLLGIASLYQLSVVALGAAWALAGAFLDRSEGRRPDPGWAWVALGA